jgi:hypothetical protein
MNIEKLVMRTAIVVGLLCIAGVAQAQTWDTNTLTWQAPTTCTSGVPISNCPVTMYRVERSATATGAYASVGTSTSLTYTHLSAAAGQNCYRVIAVAATGESDPSNVACKTNTRPAGPPSPPTNLTVTVAVVWNSTFVPVMRLSASGTINTNPVGMVAVGRRVDEAVKPKWKGFQMCRIRVASQDMIVNGDDMTNLVAPCGSSA